MGKCEERSQLEIWGVKLEEMSRIGSESCQTRKIVKTTPALFNQGTLSKNWDCSSWQFLFDNFLPIIPGRKPRSVSEMPTRPSLFRVPKSDKQRTKWA